MVDWVTTKEAAQIANCTVHQIRNLIQNKVLIAEKKGGQFWISRASLTAFESARTARQTTIVPSKSDGFVLPESWSELDPESKIRSTQQSHENNQAVGLNLSLVYRTLICAYLRIHSEERQARDAKHGLTP